MDKRFVCTVLAVLLVTAGTTALVRHTETPPAAQIDETVSGIDHPEEGLGAQPVQEEEPEWQYMIREYEGRIAVFTAESGEEPEVVWETLVKYLPDYDQAQLKQGIPVNSYQDLVARIEDYVS